MRFSFSPSRQQVLDQLGDQLVIRIRPASVSERGNGRYPVTGHLPRLLGITPQLKTRLFKVAKRSEPFILPSVFCKQSKPIAELKKYIFLKDLLAHDMQPDQSLWYQSLCRTLRRQGYACYKKFKFVEAREIEAFLKDYVLGLAKNLQTYGYDDAKGKDFARVYVGANGQLIKSCSGEHRFYLSHLLNIDSVPVLIHGVHQRWATNNNIQLTSAGLDHFIHCIAQVERAHQ